MGTERRNNSKKRQQKGYGNILFVCILAFVLDLVFAAVSHWCIGAAAGEVYYQMIFLPLSAFVVAFFALLKTRNVLLSMIVPFVAHFLLYWIMVGLSLSVILWMLLYMFSGFIGLAMGYIVVTHKD